MTAALRYGPLAKTLHWLIALGMVYTFALGWIMTSMVGISPAKLKYFSWHKWAGVSIFAIALVRILWRVIHPPKPLPDTITGVHRSASALMHLVLYAATLAVPLTGYLYSFAAGYPVVYFGLFPLPAPFAKNLAWAEPLRLSHAWMSYLMATCVVLHSLAALVHHFYYRDAVLKDMLPRYPGRSDPRGGEG